jgi:hypothetical protein
MELVAQLMYYIHVHSSSCNIVGPRLGGLDALSRCHVCLSISARHSSYDLNSKHDYHQGYHHLLSLLSSTKKISTLTLI